jgi:hypothetical protein
LIEQFNDLSRIEWITLSFVLHVALFPQNQSCFVKTLGGSNNGAVTSRRNISPVTAWQNSSLRLWLSRAISVEIRLATTGKSPMGCI